MFITIDPLETFITLLEKEGKTITKRQVLNHNQTYKILCTEEQKEEVKK